MKNWIINPKLRIITALLMMIVGVSLHDLRMITWLLLFGQGLLVINRVPFLFFWKRLRVILPFMLFTCLFFPLYEQGDAIISVLGLSVTWQGVSKAYLFVGRLLFVTQILTLLFSAVTISLFLQVLHHLKVPDIFIQLLQFTLRFMEVFSGEAIAMKKAIQSRGYRLRTWFTYRNYVTLASLLGSLFVRAIHRSERIYLGMLSRGYRGAMPVSSFAAPSRVDWLQAAISVGVMGLIVGWKYLFRN